MNWSPPSRETYNALTNWLTDARTLASPNIVIILCGNKKDLDAEREVTFLEASRFAQENGEGLCPRPAPPGINELLGNAAVPSAELMFLETSALTGENVEEAFLKCARTILNKIESGEEALPGGSRASRGGAWGGGLGLLQRFGGLEGASGSRGGRGWVLPEVSGVWG